MMGCKTLYEIQISLIIHVIIVYHPSCSCHSFFTAFVTTEMDTSLQNNISHWFWKTKILLHQIFPSVLVLRFIVLEVVRRYLQIINNKSVSYKYIMHAIFIYVMKKKACHVAAWTSQHFSTFLLQVLRFFSRFTPRCYTHVTMLIGHILDCLALCQLNKNECWAIWSAIFCIEL